MLQLKNSGMKNPKRFMSSVLLGFVVVSFLITAGSVYATPGKTHDPGPCELMTVPCIHPVYSATGTLIGYRAPDPKAIAASSPTSGTGTITSAYCGFLPGTQNLVDCGMSFSTHEPSE